MSEWAQMLQIGAQDLGERVVDERAGTTQQLRFASGLVAHSMSSNFNAQAGKRGHRILDEFALHEQQRQLFAIAEPGITWGGRLSIFSTHRGSASFFNQLVREAREGSNPKRFSLHRVTLQDALEDGFLFKLQSKLPEGHEVQGMDEAGYFDYKRSGSADEESFLQEYLCVPADDASAFLSYEQICAVEYPPGEAWEWGLAEMARSHDPLYVGVDIGRDHDLTVIWVLQRTGGMYFTRAVIEMAGVPFRAQEAELYPILGLPRVVRCCIDQTGIGRQFAERAAERYGAGKVEGVTFTVASKDEMATPLRGLFQDRLLRIPQRDAIRTDLRSIKRIPGAGDVVRYAADRGKNGHADRFWGLGLAVRAGATAGSPAAPRSWSDEELMRTSAGMEGLL
jgi:phage FluMu gp28-like protein